MILIHSIFLSLRFYFVTFLFCTPHYLCYCLFDHINGMKNIQQFYEYSHLTCYDYKYGIRSEIFYCSWYPHSHRRRLRVAYVLDVTYRVGSRKEAEKITTSGEEWV